ncbi:MAG: tetratricopeptide repeat protein [Gammaproteobacteria bacterium]|nr:tetratricopeptide repeat protein [Gammaproteobacteria bacterium]
MIQYSRLLISAIIFALSSLPVQAASFKQAKKLYAAADYSAAIEELQPLAKAGNADASNLLGEMYWQGLGVQSDIAKAKVLFQAGANTGHLAALNNLDGILDVEYKLELKSIEPLAANGNAEAQNRLGRMYEFGQDHDINPKLAFSWYKKAAAQGNIEGQMNVARSYNFALGTDQDLIQAEAGYLSNAQAGHIDSMFFLGTMHFAQISQAADDADRQAYAWLKLAAENGHATAAAMVTRLSIKLGDHLNQGEALYQEYAAAYSPAQ